MNVTEKNNGKTRVRASKSVKSSLSTIRPVIKADKLQAAPKYRTSDTSLAKLMLAINKQKPSVIELPTTVKIALIQILQR